MTKVIGPLFSLSASGTYRKEIVFTPRNGGVYVRAPAKISKLRSPAQLAQAKAVSDMSSVWAAYDAQTKLDWSNCGALVSLTGYRHFWREWFLQGSSVNNPPGLTC